MKKNTSSLILKHFDQIAEAPDAIPRLRRFILDLAVRGKLVEQDSEDCKTIEFLHKIQTEKERLTSAGKYRADTQVKSLKHDGMPFIIPTSWVWVRFGAIVISRDGERIPVSKDERNQRAKIYDYYGASGIIDKIDDFLFDKPLLLIGEDGANLINRSTPIAFIARGKYWVNNHAHVLDGISEQFLRFLELYINAIDLKPYVTGTAQPKMNQAKMNSIPIALPPESEQQRIVTKVEELMALCDDLEKVQAKRESRRERLVAATLAGISNPQTEINDSKFFINHLPRITFRPEHIKQLRQTILNLAVRGKLVPQDPSDEPALKLIEHIREEKLRQLKDKKIKTDSLFNQINDTNAPFPLPLGWTWARFPELGIFGRGKSKHRPRNDPSLFTGGTHLFVQTGDVARSNGIIKTFTGKYNDVGHAQSYKWPKGTLCITIAANIADSGILSFDACFPDSVVGFIPASVFPHARYFEYFIRTAKSQLLEFASATAQKNINLGILNEVLIPLPPLAEQHRIVAKVDELMSLCDELETRLTTSATTRRQLLEATLHEELAVN